MKSVLLMSQMHLALPCPWENFDRHDNLDYVKLHKSSDVVAHSTGKVIMMEVRVEKANWVPQLLTILLEAIHTISGTTIVLKVGN